MRQRLIGPASKPESQAVDAPNARSGRRLPAEIGPQNDAELVASDRARHGQPAPDAGAGTSAARPQGPPETSSRQPVIRQLPSPHSAVIRLVPVPSGAETAHCASILPGFSAYSRMIGSFPHTPELRTTCTTSGGALMPSSVDGSPHASRARSVTTATRYRTSPAVTRTGCPMSATVHC